MELFVSAEIDATVTSDYGEIREEIQSKLKVLSDRYYGKALNNVCIIVIIINLELEAAGFFKEMIKYSRKNKDADVRLKIDYLKYLNGDTETRRKLMVKNIIDSISALKLKVQKEFDADQLKDDVLKVLNLTNKDIEDI